MQKKITRMFIASLVIVPKDQQSRIDKYLVVYSCKRAHHSAMETNKRELFAITQISLINIIITKGSQAHKIMFLYVSIFV